MVTAIGSMQKMEQGCNKGFWRHLKAHTMGKVTSWASLNQIANKIGEVWDNCWQAQTSQWHNFLYTRGYTGKNIEAFCWYSLMLVILTTTYHNFYKLLGKLQDLLNSAEGCTTWKRG